MQYFIKVKFRRLLAVIEHCRASTDYKIRKHYSTRFGILLRTIDEPSWVDIFYYQFTIEADYIATIDVKLDWQDVRAVISLLCDVWLTDCAIGVIDRVYM